MKLLFLGWAAALPLVVVAQVPGLPSVPGLTRLPGALEPVTRLRPLAPVREALQGVTGRVDLVNERLRRDAALWMPDRTGHPVLRRQLIWMQPRAEARARAEAAGWQWLEPLSLPALGVDAWRVMPPPGVDAVAAQARIEAEAAQAAGDGESAVELEHLYTPAGAVEGLPAWAASAGPEALAPPDRALRSARTPRLGLLDTGVDRRHPALAEGDIQVLGCAPKPHGHGTAVASALVGQGDGLRSGAPGVALAAVDVDCGAPGGSSASRLVQGLEALVQARVPVVNISLVGPPNRLVAAAVAAAQAQGVLIVAAAGNDGPAAPPLYPAAYPGVVGVAATDERRKPLPESARGEAVRASAVGAAVPVAQLGGGLAQARGTSFAAPWVAGRLALAWGEAPPSVARAERVRNALRQQLDDLGDAGPDPIYGWGWAGPRWRLELK